MEKILYSILLTIACLGAFAKLPQGDYVWNDRKVLGIEQDGGQGLLVPMTLQTIWTPVRGEPYEPLAPTIRQLLPQTPKALHILHGFLHLGSSILVLLIVSLILQSSGAALMGALLFALHPLQVEPVAYIAAGKFILGAFLSLFTLWQYLLYCEHKASQSRSSGKRYAQLASLAFVLALLSTPGTAVTPVLAWVLGRSLPKRSSMVMTRLPVWPVWLWTVLALLPLVWAFAAHRLQPLMMQTDVWKRPFVAGDALAFYLSKLIAPVMIGPDYGRTPAYALQHWWGYFTWLVPLVLFIVLSARREPLRSLFGTAISLFVLALLPYLGLIAIDDHGASLVANSFVYLAMLGPALALSGAVALGRRTWFPLLILFVLVSFAYLSAQNLEHWQTERALWKHAIAVNPKSPVVNQTLGDQYRRAGRWDEAQYHYEQVLAVHQGSADLYFHLGEMERQREHAVTAANYYEKALALDPGLKKVHRRLGQAYLAQADRSRALEQFRKALEFEPEQISSLRYVGRIHVEAKEFNEAVPYLEKVLQLASPEQVVERTEAQTLLGQALFHTQRIEEAQKLLEEALVLDPGHAETHRILAEIYYSRGMLAEARPHLEFTLRTPSDDAELYRRLGESLAAVKQHEKAIVAFERALDLKKDWPLALTQAGTSYFQLRRLKEASTLLRQSLALNPQQAESHYVLGDMARWMGRKAEALAEYHSALRIDPDHTQAHIRLGTWFLQKEQPTDAARHFKAALRSRPQDEKVLSLLQKAEREAGGRAG